MRAALDGAFVFEFFQYALQRDAVVAFDAERARNVALGAARRLGERFEHARLVEFGGAVASCAPSLLAASGSAFALSAFAFGCGLCAFGLALAFAAGFSFGFALFLLRLLLAAALGRALGDQCDAPVPA